MLNHKSMPVWALADSLMFSLAAGSMFVLLAVAFALPNLLHSSTGIDIAEMKRLRGSLHSATNELDDTKQAVDSLIAQLAQVSDEKRHGDNVLQAQIELIRKQNTELVEQDRRLKNEGTYRKELLNLTGSFARVVFVVDTSGSMGYPLSEGTTAAGENVSWDIVVSRCEAWLTHLPVEEFRVVYFNSEIGHFPQDRSRWLSRDVERREAISDLRKQPADGYTFTEAALRNALSFEPTAIVLFTDGMPSDAEGNADVAQQDRVLALMAGTRIPVHVVAVSNYFDSRCGSFLHNLSSQTGGSFIGF